ncbi:DUF2510 domain-containing protein [Amycolatopsis echigonensis]|uniref:DUF2510 domain-containing protein n=2 Tax=Amycolatopsis echigonensis TaxID=2576905 RepID=A0A8E2B2Q9_9PSEU|nr:DUF2510 domain-containing protein [Amycolatopsis echigonensis]
MGLIRKTLMLGTGGLVRGSSKKQRVAKAQLNELRKQTRLAESQAGANDAQGSGYAPGTLGDRLHQRRQAKQAAPASAGAPPAPEPGWYPAAQYPGHSQWWDGGRWTDAFNPPLP